MEPVTLNLGKLRMELDEGGLRYISYDKVELVRGIYAAVRDENWNTITPSFRDVQVTEDTNCGITINFQSEHMEKDIDFIWKGAIQIQADHIWFDFDGYARSSFLKNRIGFCVLHPMSFAGSPVHISNESGTIHGEFPVEIAPHQPFKGITGMTYEPAPGLQVKMAFEGDQFEMEDQRNWTDASYKTYCTPLELPYPVRVEVGHRVTQSIQMQIHAELGEEKEKGVEDDQRIAIEVGDEAVLQSLPEIGYAVTNREPSEFECQWLKQLKPAYLRLELNLSENDWREKWGSALRWCRLYGCGIELELLMEATSNLGATGAKNALEFEDSRSSLLEFVNVLAAEPLMVRSIIPFAADTSVSDKETIQVLKQALQEAGLIISVGGGVRTYYAEHNRAFLPLELMDFTSYSINPQVHAFDDRSLMETLPAQKAIATDAAVKTGKPIHIGPITLKPRLNPNATSGESRIKQEDQIDNRQQTLFGAAWTLGSVAALCGQEAEFVQRITYYELLGPIGLVNSHAYPLFYVLRDIDEIDRAQVLRIRQSSDQVAALALREGSRMRLMLANLTNSNQQTAITSGKYSAVTIRTLDADSYQRYYSNPSRWQDGLIAGQDSDIDPDQDTDPELDTEVIKIRLSPYAYVCLDYDSWNARCESRMRQNVRKTGEMRWSRESESGSCAGYILDRDSV